MTDDAGRSVPGGNQPSPPQGQYPQGMPYPPPPYPPQTYAPQSLPQPPLPQPQSYPHAASSHPAPAYPPPYAPPHLAVAQTAPPGPDGAAAAPWATPGSGRRRTIRMVVGGVVGVLVLAAVGTASAIAGRGSADDDAADPLPLNPAAANPAAPLPNGPAAPAASGDPSAVPSGPAASPGTRTGSSVALSRGDCILSLPKGQNILTITLVACTTPHEAQVGYTFSPNGAEYPGGTALAEIVRRECPARLNRSIRGDAPQLSWTGYYPEAVEWESGDHSIKCLVMARDGKPLTRSVVR